MKPRRGLAQARACHRRPAPPPPPLASDHQARPHDPGIPHRPRQDPGGRRRQGPGCAPQRVTRRAGARRAPRLWMRARSADRRGGGGGGARRRGPHRGLDPRFAASGSGRHLPSQMDPWLCWICCVMAHPVGGFCSLSAANGSGGGEAATQHVMAAAKAGEGRSLCTVEVPLAWQHKSVCVSTGCLLEVSVRVAFDTARLPAAKVPPLYGGLTR
jgi:hypothetical protein